MPTATLLCDKASAHVPPPDVHPIKTLSAELSELPPPPPHSYVIGDVGNPRIIVNGKPIVGQGANIVPGGKVLMGSYSVYM